MYAGAQLFTVRKYTQTPEDLRNTFKRLQKSVISMHRFQQSVRLKRKNFVTFQ